MPSWKKVIISGSNAALNSLTVTNGITGSLFGTSSWAVNAQTASFVTASNVYGPFGSNSVATASYALTSSFSLASTANSILVINKSGATITKGMVVHLTGSNNSSDTPYVITASYESDSLSANTLGIASETIAFNNTGYITTEGVLTGVNVTGFTSGQVIYLGATGSITGSAPLAPLHSVRLGQVVRDSPSNNGAIYVRIDNGYELGELHDIVDRTTTSSYGDLLVKSGSVWTNSRQLTGSYGLTGSLQATSFTGSFSGSHFGPLTGTASYATQALSASFSSTSSFLNSTTNAFIQNGNSFGTTALLGTNDNQSLAFETSGSTNMFISSSGDVGVGTTAPGARLHVYGGNSGATPSVYSGTLIVEQAVATSIQLISANTQTQQIRFGDPQSGLVGRLEYSHADNSMRMVTNAGEKMRIDSAGNVGIGTTTPNSGSLHVNGNVFATSFTGSLFGTASWASNAITASNITPAITNSSDNRVLTDNGDGTINGEVGLTFDGSLLVVRGSLAQGDGSAVAAGNFSHAQGDSSEAQGDYSHAEGGNTIASGSYSHAEGVNTQAIGEGSHAEGKLSIASGIYSHAEGVSAQAIGEYSHAEGGSTQALGNYSHAEGDGTISSGSYSHAEGYETVALGQYSHAEGGLTVSSGHYSHAEGLSTLASGIYSHAEGSFVTASGNYSHAAGFNTVASGDYQSVIGQYNISSSAQSAFIVGNGTGTGASRRNLIFASGSQVQVTGSVIATQGFSGSLFGTSSWATNAQTASFVTTAQTASYVLQAVSSSFASTASFVTTAQTASFVTTAQTASFVTASNVFGPFGSNSVISASFAVSSSRAVSSSFATTASYVLQAVSSSFASTASFVTASNVFGPFGSNSILSSSFAVSSSRAVTSSFAVTASFVTTAQTASYVLQAVSSSFATTATTASYVLNAVSASFASTASSVNTLNQNVLITGSLTVGSSSLGASENTITLGARDAAGEGGQLGFNAPGGTYTSASMIDNYQNRLRILRGTNAGSDAEVAWWSMHNKQMALPAYNSVSAFSGTATALLAVDTSGNVITVATGSGGGGSGTVTQVNTAGSVNGITLTGGPITTTGTITLGGTLSNVQSSQLATSSLMIGNSSISLGATASSLTGLTSVTATSFTGSLQGTSSWATNATNAVNVGITDNPSSGGGPFYIPFVATSTGNTALQVDSSTFLYAPSTNTITVANLAGTASYATQALSASFAISSSYAEAARTVGITLQDTTPVTYNVTFTGGTSGNNALGVDSTTLTYNPSTSTFTTPIVNSTTAVQGGDGSVSAPAFSFSGDTDTGMYNAGANIIGFAQGGQIMAIMSASGFHMNSSGTKTFEIGAGSAGDTNLVFSPNTTGGTGGNINVNHPSLPLIFKLNSAERVRITTAGNVGIGTTTPNSGSLHVNGNVFATSYTGSLFGTASFATTASFLNSTTNAFIQNGNSFGTQALLGTNDNQPLALETNATERIRITSAGDVGIGTTSPNARLDVNGNTIITGSALITGSLGITGSLNLIYNTPSSNGISVTGHYPRLTLINSGSGATAAGGIISTRDNNFITKAVNADVFSISALDAGSSSVGRVVFTKASNNSTNVSIWNSGTEGAFYISGSGNIGVGKTTPNARLDVSGSAIISGSFTVTPGTVREFQVRTTGVDIGNLITDTHTVTGSLNVSGSITGSLSGTATSANTLTNTRTIWGQNFNGSANVTGNLTSVGTISGSAGVDLDITAGAGARITLMNPGTDSVRFGTSNTVRWSVDGTTGNLLSAGAQTIATNTGNLTLATNAGNGNILLTPNGTGNVGIGTTAPQSILDVITPANGYASFANQISVGQYSGIHFGYRESNSSYRKSAIVFERTDLTSNNAQGKVHILNGPQSGAGSATLSDAKLTINETGNVGIGTTSPNFLLDISGSANITGSLNVGISTITTARSASSAAGANTLFTQATGSFTAAKYFYTVTSASNARTGEVMAVWNGTSVQYTDNSTLDIGSTTAVTASVSIVSSQAQFNMQTTNAGWTIKSQVTYL